jgi:hypothetical protein
MIIYNTLSIEVQQEVSFFMSVIKDAKPQMSVLLARTPVATGDEFRAAVAAHAQTHYAKV